MWKIAAMMGTCLFGLYLMKRFMTVFFGPDVKDKRKEWILYGLFYALLGVAISQLYEGSQKKKILVTFLVYSICMVCEVLVMYSFSMYVRESELQIIISFITVLLVSVCEFVIERFLVRHSGEYSIPHCDILILVPLISIALLLYLVMSGLKQRTVFIAVSLVLLLINLLIFYLCDVLTEAFSDLEEMLICQPAHCYDSVRGKSAISET